jgi:hypothetical protein
MKKCLLLIACLLFSISLCAQQDTISKSAIYFNGIFSDFTFSWNKKEKRSFLIGEQIGFANLTGLDGVELNPWSFTIGANLFNITHQLNSHWVVGLGMGLAIDFYEFRGNTGLQQVDGITQFVLASENRQYKRSTLMTSCFSFPLLVEYHTKIKRKMFFVHGGVEVCTYGYNSGSIIKVKNGSDTNMETYRPLNFSTQDIYRFILRLGSEDIGLFGYYQSTPIFEKNKGPNLHPWGVGLYLPF